jgi:hypothetical protein
MSPHLGGGGPGPGSGMMMQQQMQHAGMPLPQGPAPPPDHGRPPANQPYMPQQNCIYVFDTKLANEAANAVSQQTAQDIIQYHRRQEETTRFLTRCQMEGRTWDTPSPHPQVIS